MPATRSDRPVPRLSKMITRANSASAAKKRAPSGSSQVNSTFENDPGVQTRSTGPSPTTW